MAEARPWTNREATDSHTVPGRLAVVGGGGVGVEMASAWQGLGASVILLVRADGLLPRMEPFAGETDRPRRSPVRASTCGSASPSPRCAATVAAAGQVPIARLWHAVPCFPSISEVWLRLLEAYRN